MGDVENETGFESHKIDFVGFKIEEVEVFWRTSTFEFTQHYIDKLMNMHKLRNHL